MGELFHLFITLVKLPSTLPFRVRYVNPGGGKWFLYICGEPASLLSEIQECLERKTTALGNDLKKRSSNRQKRSSSTTSCVGGKQQVPFQRSSVFRLLSLVFCIRLIRSHVALGLFAPQNNNLEVQLFPTGFWQVFTPSGPKIGNFVDRPSRAEWQWWSAYLSWFCLTHSPTHKRETGQPERIGVRLWSEGQIWLTVSRHFTRPTGKKLLFEFKSEGCK